MRPIIERCRGPMMQALQDSKLTPLEIDKIILVGGPTRMPIVRQFISTIMSKEAEGGIDPDGSGSNGCSNPGSNHCGRCLYGHSFS